jgi:serine/threonine protein phosphatase PrpC
MSTTISFAKHSRIGKRKNNEDAAEIATRPNSALLVVADGLGGHSGGEIASQTLIDTIVKCFNEATNEQLQNQKAFFPYAVTEAHRAIHKAAVAAGKIEFDPKTTCVIAMIYGNNLHWCHVGDSRLYLVRDGMIAFHTTDHIAKGFKKNAPINRCVGGAEVPKATLNEPLKLEDGDMVFLCTDGAWHKLTLPDLLKIDYKNPQADIEKLLKKIEERNNAPSDNVTAIAACYGSKS